MNEVYSAILQTPSYTELMEALEQGRSFDVEGVSESLLPTLLEGMIKPLSRPLMIVTPTEREGRALCHQLRDLGCDVLFMPARDKVYYAVHVVHNETMVERLDAIRALADRRKKSVICSIKSFYDTLLSLDLYRAHTIHLREGEARTPESIVSTLVDAGYTRVSVVETRGEFSLRGGILDVYPSEGNARYRIEFFDDVIDTIRLVDFESLRSKESLSALDIFPAKEILLPNTSLERIADALSEEYKHHASPSHYAHETYPQIIEELRLGVFDREREMLLHLLPPEMRSTTEKECIKAGWSIAMVEPARAAEMIVEERKMQEMDCERYLEGGEILVPQAMTLLDDALLQGRLPEGAVTLRSITPRIGSDLPADGCFSVEPMMTGRRQPDEIASMALDFRCKRAVLYLALAPGPELDAICQSLSDHGISYSSSCCGEVRMTEPRNVPGFYHPAAHAAVLTAYDLQAPVRKKTKASRKTSSLRLTELSSGDYVIHEDHGAGIYRGVVTLEIKGIKRDYLEIDYKGSDKLYVPVENINLIDKYMSREGAKPKIHALDSAQWKSTKERSRKAIEEMARDLVELYAARAQMTGHAFSPDGPWQRDFEDDFPFEDTDSQRLATQEIKNEMESPHPMDRLLLGDVGYGKTEVAFRAAFKAIMDGKQVAFLTPTTLLAEQHYRTALERFGNFPVSIGMVSRFCTPHRIQRTLEALAKGELDMVIGTHRLLSSDVHYKDLGLLIIDEEQRFGVRHKEKMKQLSRNIDALTLSATPIPRTLHMSLSGIRSLSVLEEPPENRIPVQTYVLGMDDRVLSSGIRREMDRGGQVYVLYNDVAHMDAMRAHLLTLVPEASVDMANGQMPERQLEKVFEKFLQREIDVLVTSTIIETGMDIPNVNTLFVLDADRLGLSTLYQLRGRVGRSNRLAYAYFMYRQRQMLSEKASKRLMAIREFTDFGSGYKIAMRDLELRGAGNVLGTRQHGHMADIGYELYRKFLQEAVQKLRGEGVQEEVHTQVDVQVEARIPEHYLDDAEARMEVYRKISALKTEEERCDLIDELIDRYGDVPVSLECLTKVGLLKNIASTCGVERIVQHEHAIKIFYHPSFLDHLDVSKAMEVWKDRLRFDPMRPMLTLKTSDPLRDLEVFFEAVLFNAGTLVYNDHGRET